MVAAIRRLAWIGWGIGLPALAATAIVAGTVYGALLTDTAEATQVGAVQTVEIEGPGTVVTGGVGHFTAIVTDAEGAPVAGTTVTFAVSNVVAGDVDANTVSPIAVETDAEGAATTMFTSGGQRGTFELTATAGDPPQTGSLTFNVDDAPGPPSGFSVEPHAGGLTITTYSGTIVQLEVDAAALNLVSCFATVEGQFAGYIFGAPAFVNAQFVAHFAAGLDNRGLICRRT